jgi:hypothetical protein
MAKHVAKAGRLTKGKPKPKREPNAQRRARADERRTTLQMADYLADLIRSRRQNKAALAPLDDDLNERALKKMGWHPESKYWLQAYAFLGQVFCEFHDDPAKFLRLVADSFDAERPLYDPHTNWYDRAIAEAYKAAAISDSLLFLAQIGNRKASAIQLVKNFLTQGEKVHEKKVVPYVVLRPSFSKFSDFFRKQHPKLKVDDSSLRRTLNRLGFITRPDKRGRPKEK